MNNKYKSSIGHHSSYIRETEKILKDISYEAENETTEEKLLAELDARLSEYNKEINRGASVRIIDRGNKIRTLNLSSSYKILHF